MVKFKHKKVLSGNEKIKAHHGNGCFPVTMRLMHKWIHRDWARLQQPSIHRYKLHEVPGMCGKWTWVPISDKDGICNLYLPERENLFPVMEWIYVYKKLQSLWVAGQHKMNSRFFYDVSGIILYFFHFFYLFLWYFWEKQREKIKSYLGRIT